MAKTIEQLIQIASAGGGLVIDGNGKTIGQLKRIVTAAAEKKVTVIIRNADSKTVDQLKDIASEASGNVIFDLYA